MKKLSLTLLLLLSTPWLSAMVSLTNNSKLLTNPLSKKQEKQIDLDHICLYTVKEGKFIVLANANLSENEIEKLDGAKLHYHHLLCMDAETTKALAESVRLRYRDLERINGTEKKEFSDSEQDYIKKYLPAHYNEKYYRESYTLTNFNTLTQKDIEKLKIEKIEALQRLEELRKKSSEIKLAVFDKQTEAKLKTEFGTKIVNETFEVRKTRMPSFEAINDLAALKEKRELIKQVQALEKELDSADTESRKIVLGVHNTILKNEIIERLKLIAQNEAELETKPALAIQKERLYEATVKQYDLKITELEPKKN